MRSQAGWPRFSCIEPNVMIRFLDLPSVGWPLPPPQRMGGFVMRAGNLDYRARCDPFRVGNKWGSYPGVALRLPPATIDQPYRLGGEGVGPGGPSIA